jgi:hypothetical protein
MKPEEFEGREHVEEESKKGGVISEVSSKYPRY